MPLDVVVEFKRGVYRMALTELARFLPRHEQRNRYLRGSFRAREPEQGSGTMLLRHGHLLLHRDIELPPGATFDPDPGTNFVAEPQPSPATAAVD